jgi:hypothetical protein
VVKDCSSARWVQTRWGSRLSRWWERVAQKIHNYLHPRSRSFGGTYWLWHWAPRTCTFCGGVHPNDAVRLIREGWHVDATDKKYKRYLEPPGGVMNRFGYNPPWHAVPPVKLYTNHFDKSSIARFNQAVRDQRKEKPDAPVA